MWISVIVGDDDDRIFGSIMYNVSAIGIIVTISMLLLLKCQKLSCTAYFGSKCLKILDGHHEFLIVTIFLFIANGLFSNFIEIC